MTQSPTPFNLRACSRSGLVVLAGAALLAACGPVGGDASSAASSSVAPSEAAVAPSSAPSAAAATPALPAGWTLYQGTGFTIGVPPGYAVDPAHDYQALGPGKDIRGVAFTIPASVATGTNLGQDTYLSVETLPNASPCTAGGFLSGPKAGRPVTEDGVTYSVATGNDAGAGNFYDETVYAAQGSSPCLAVRYFIHSLNIGNFDPGAVKAFDRAALVAQFTAMRKTLTIK